MNEPVTQNAAESRWAITVRGVVQGVGFRPFVYNTARALGLSGWVKNESGTVRIEVQGPMASLDQFLIALQGRHPPQARIDQVEVVHKPRRDAAPREFRIRRSAKRGAPRPAIPADLATCAECLQEIRTPGERRHQYPFTNCTNCGPRWSIIERLPYDRPRTSMAGFVLCPACRTQYEDPADRRFHAQPIACPECGPQLTWLDASGVRAAAGAEALQRTVEAIRAGRVVALQGLGGFQLICDATNRRAVSALRHRKHRPDRPFAVMLASLDEVRARCEVSAEEAAALQSPQAPILLLRRRMSPPSDDVAPEVAPGNPYLGVMLPYSPLHHLLMAAVERPVVCTSGNLSDEPMAIETEDALERLGGIAESFLVHNRPIVRPVDDSVARLGPEGLQLIRRARGYAPLAIDVGVSGPVVLAVGGHLKNTVALSLGSQVVVSPHVGDLDGVLSLEVHRRAIADLVRFFRVTPQVVACDLHPDYASTRHAEAVAAQWGAPLARVQHHEAHVAACMAEHRLTGPVLGLAWDGTGFGPDGTVWGGEAIECNGTAFRRLAHLRQFALPGGDRAVRQPRRSALGVLYELLGPEAQGHAAVWFRPGEKKYLFQTLGRLRLSPRTSSMGRLFDAVAAVCGLSTVVSFEGQAAMALEFAADRDGTEAYPLPLSAGDGPAPDQAAVGDWGPMVRCILADLAAGEPVARISTRFHNALADWAVAVARLWGGSQVVLSGGCFQNALLTEWTRSRLLDAGFRVFLHRQVPPGDGGISLGQVYHVFRHPR